MNPNQGSIQLVRAKVLAEILDVSTRTIRTWQKEGRIPYVQISPGTIRFDLGEVSEALEKKKIGRRA